MLVVEVFVHVPISLSFERFKKIFNIKSITRIREIDNYENFIKNDPNFAKILKQSKRQCATNIVLSINEMKSPFSLVVQLTESNPQIARLSLSLSLSESPL